MAEPDWNPDTAGRSLAEILREADSMPASRRISASERPPVSGFHSG